MADQAAANARWKTEEQKQREYQVLRQNTGGTDLPVMGNNDQIVAGITGEGVARKLFGAGANEAGEINKRVLQEREAALNQTDPVSTRIKQGSNIQTRAARAAAGAQGKNLSTGEEAQIRRTAETDTADALYKNRQQSLNDYARAGGALSSNTLSTVMGYQGIGTAATPVQVGSSGMTVICTELHRRGLLSNKVIESDRAFGEFVRREDPLVYVGYRVIADPIVFLMKKSDIVTWFVGLFAIPWAKYMSGEKNLIGPVVSYIGMPLCKLIGKVKYEIRKRMFC